MIMRDLAERVRDATTTLVAAPSMEGAGTDICRHLLAQAAADDRDVLVVAYSRSPRECVAHLPDGADAAGVIVVGDAPHEQPATDDVSVDAVSSAEDVTALGIMLSRALAEADGDLAVCFDSVSAMLQYVERDTAYEFLHTITRQLYATDARAHLHLDPTAHDEATVDLLTSLCDAVVDLSDEPSVRTRAAVE